MPSGAISRSSARRMIWYMPMATASPIAIITGAGKGIGRETALALAREGAVAICVARTQQDLRYAYNVSAPLLYHNGEDLIDAQEGDL